MKKILGFGIAFLLTASLASAQMPPGKWWQRPELVQDLQLTAEQRDKLDAVFQNAATELIDRKADVEKAQVALRGELDRPEIRKAELQKIVTQVSQARARQFEREVMMLVDMRSVLNEEQWRKMKTHLDERQQRRRQGPQPEGGRKPPAGRRPER